MRRYYMNIQDGYLVDYDEMMKICREEYDLDDDTNALNWREYFEPTNLPCE